MKRGKRLLAALLGGLLIGLLPLGALAEEAPAVIVDIEGGETAEALMAEDADEVWEPVGTVPADTAAESIFSRSSMVARLVALSVIKTLIRIGYAPYSWARLLSHSRPTAI